MVVTLKDVAERAGVSRSAVSRSFTEGASVSAKTRAKVEKAANDLGYTPNALASSLTTGRTKLIGLIVNNFHNPLILEVFDLFTRGLQDRGLRPLLVNLSDETDPARSVQMLRQYSVEGVIVATSHLPDGFARAFRDAGVAVVHAFGRPTGQTDVVGIDNVAAGQMAAQTLIARGYRSVGFLGGPDSATSTQDRAAGFLTTLAAHRGKWVVVNFWATWCAPCRKEMPELSALHAMRSNIEVVGLAYEDIETPEMQAFLAKHPVTYPIVVVDPFDPPADFATPRGLPLTHLIDPQGKLAHSFLGPVTAADIEQQIAAAK